MKKETNQLKWLQTASLIFFLALIPLILQLPLIEFTCNQAVRDLIPNTQLFWRIVTELGGKLIYLGLFFIIFWVVDKVLVNRIKKYLLASFCVSLSI
ncbi:MAG: hypothetical protein ACFFAU_09200 [Candidatus Hodarchaeota archaeon]